MYESHTFVFVLRFRLIFFVFLDAQYHPMLLLVFYKKRFVFF